MKKIFSLMLLVFASIVLVACSSKSELDGEYYWINEYRHELRMMIDGKSGFVNIDGTEYPIIEVNDDAGTVTVSTDIGNRTYDLKYSEGQAVSPGDEYEVYKKGTPTFEKVLKEYGYTEKDLED